MIACGPESYNSHLSMSRMSRSWGLGKQGDTCIRSTCLVVSRLWRPSRSHTMLISQSLSTSPQQDGIPAAARSQVNRRSYSIEWRSSHILNRTTALGTCEAVEWYLDSHSFFALVSCSSYRHAECRWMILAITGRPRGRLFAVIGPRFGTWNLRPLQAWAALTRPCHRR